MTDWWNRPAPGEGWELQIDMETGRGGWRYHEHLWLVPVRGLLDLWRDLSAVRLGFWHWFAIGALIGLVANVR